MIWVSPQIINTCNLLNSKCIRVSNGVSLLRKLSLHSISSDKPIFICVTSLELFGDINGGRRKICEFEKKKLNYIRDLIEYDTHAYER